MKKIYCQRVKYTDIKMFISQWQILNKYQFIQTHQQKDNL